MLLLLLPLNIIWSFGGLSIYRYWDMAFKLEQKIDVIQRMIMENDYFPPVFL